MRRQHRRGLLTLLMTLALGGCSALPMPFSNPTAAPPAPEATLAPTAIALSNEVRVEPSGLSLRIPADWVSQEISGTLTLAPTAADLGRTTPGPALVISVDATLRTTLTERYGEAAAANPDTLFELSSGLAQESGYSIGATSPITVANLPGIVGDLSVTGAAGQLVVLIAPDRAVRILALADEATWQRDRAAFEAIINSLNLFALVIPPTPTPVDAVVQPSLRTDGPEGFVLRLGGDGGPTGGRFESARGMAAAPDGTLYLAESRRGVWVFGPDGVLQRTFGSTDLLDAYDVALTPDGNLLVADYGRSAIARFSPSGEFLGRFGSAGEAPEQFGFAAPQRIAVGFDGAIYALDSRAGADGSPAASIMRFNPDGSFRDRLSLPTGSAPADLAVDAEGNIYLAETIDGSIVKLAAGGSEIARFGGTAAGIEGGIIASALDLDRLGNIYVATWNAGVLKLSPQGFVIGRGGAVAPTGTRPAAGQFALPNGIVAAPGGIIWVSDKSGEYSAITALRLAIDPGLAQTIEAQPTVEIVSETPVATPPPAAALFRQWANSATASSSYGEDYGPDGATGAPNVPTCGSSPDAWAAADPNGLETLEVRYERPVFALEVVIYQNHQPGFVSKIELIDEQGEVTSVFEGTPALSPTCPLVQAVQFDQTLRRIVGVRLTIDQRSGANWNEIDAVELVGFE